MNKSNKDLFSKKQRYSIRKYSFGAASVLVGVLFFSGIGVNAEGVEELPVAEAAESAEPAELLAAKAARNESSSCSHSSIFCISRIRISR